MSVSSARILGRWSCAALVAASLVGPQPAVAWQADQGLRVLARPLFPIGVGVDAGVADRPRDGNLLTTHFESVTAENCLKMQGLQNVEGRFRFEASDRFVDFSSRHHLKIVGHCLVWAHDDRTPAWVFRDGEQPASAERVLARLRTHIDTVVHRYKGRLEMWDVVNEALAEDGNGYLRDSGWTRATGEEFIVKAFEYARAADPDCYLIYNDYDCEEDKKLDQLLRLAGMFKSRNVPVDAIGIQGHYELDAIPFEGLDKLLGAIRELGFRVVISELDIDVVGRSQWWADNGRHREALASHNPYKDGCPPEVLQRQAEQYARLFELFARHRDMIDRVTFWNLHDGRSWLNYFPWRRVNHPLLFDREGRPKPAYHAVADVLKHARAP